MNTRILKLVLVWNAALTAILLASLVVNANFALAASDPPVKVYSSNPEHAGGLDGSASTNNVTISSDTTWSTLTSVTIDFGTQSHAHQCVAVASTDVVNPFTGASHNAYRFDITLDTTASGTDTGSGRTLDFVNNALGSTNQNVSTRVPFSTFQTAATPSVYWRRNLPVDRTRLPQMPRSPSSV